MEVPALINDSEEDVHANIAIELFSGPAPRRMKYVWFDLGNGLMIVEEHDTQSGTVYGHANAAGAEAVGAAPWYNTAAFGPQNKPECAPACLELFSSAGGVPILFDRTGRRFPFPLIRIKPGFTGPDGGNTTFFVADIAAPIPGSTEPDGFPNFFGTSASAPHVAAIGALMLDQRARDIAAGKRFIGSKQLRPDVMYIALRSVGGTAGHQAACRSRNRTDRNPAFEGIRFRFGLRLRGCGDGAAADSRLLDRRRRAGTGVRDEPHPEPRAHASLPGGVPATLRHGARSVARMPTAARRANWTGGLGRSLSSDGRASRSQCLNRALTNCQLDLFADATEHFHECVDGELAQFSCSRRPTRADAKPSGSPPHQLVEGDAHRSSRRAPSSTVASSGECR